MKTFACIVCALAAPALATTILTGCSGTAAQAAKAPKAPPPIRALHAGAVNIQQLVAAHPLYTMLAQYDREIAALRATETMPVYANSTADLEQNTTTLAHAFDEAGANVRRLIEPNAAAYERSESSAIAGAIGANAAEPTAPAARDEVSQDHRRQNAALRTLAERDAARYRDAVLAQERAALTAYEHAIVDRVHRALAARGQELQEKEAALDGDIARRDAGARLVLQMRVRNLALDRKARAQTEAELAALDRRRIEAVAAQRQQDAAALAAFRSRLEARERAAYARTAGEMQARAAANLAAGGKVFRAQATAAQGVPQDIASGGASNTATSMGEKAAQLRGYTAERFKSDASAMNCAFAHARAALIGRFSQLKGKDAASRHETDTEIAALARDRDALRGDIVVQITRDAQREARAQGLSAVYPRDKAPAGSVDLTPAVKRDLASLAL